MTVSEIQVERKTDRRIQKTKSNLAWSLGQLIIEKGYDSVTINDILNRANVGRSTFYSHYESKEQLLLGNINFLNNIVFNHTDASENQYWGVNLHYLFSHTKEYIKIYEAMRESKVLNQFSNYFTTVITTRVRNYVNANFFEVKSKLSVEFYAIEAASAGIMGMLIKWLDDGAVLPVDDMVTLAKNQLKLIIITSE